MNYNFPGNVRELENIIERGVALESSNIILPENLTLPGGLSSGESQNVSERSTHEDSGIFHIATNEDELYELGLENVITNLEKQLIRHALEKTNNSKMRAAELLRMSFRSFRYKVKKYGIQ